MNTVDIKVCGITRKKDLNALQEMGATYAGFIFYKKSERYIGDKLDPELIKNTDGIKKVGVFVNADEADILNKVKKYGLDFLQLHGDESPETCKRLRQHTRVVKAFRIKNKEDIKATENYKDSCDFFLFDTAGKHYGGNGELFNWALLDNYQGDTPFFLSGGIGLKEAKTLKNFSHPCWKAIDVNSRFEEKPGVKNTEKINQFLMDLKIN